MKIDKEEIIRYIIIGVLTTIISLGTYYISTLFLNVENKIELQICNIISWILAVTFSYILNRIYVFKSKNKVLQEVIKFYLARISTLIIDMLFMFIFVSQLSINDKISKLIVQVIIFISNYILSKFIVFKK